MPLQINSENGEPYLQLPAPHSNIRITPPRMSDVVALTAILNDPEVYPYLATPPYPYLEEHGTAFLRLAKASCDEGFAEIKQKILAGEEGYVASRCPVQTIREVQSDGTEVFIGDISFIRHAFPEIQDEEHLQRRAENEEKEKGDSSIVWTFGSEWTFDSGELNRSNGLPLPDYLAPSHHRQGIMSTALREMISQFAIPHLRARHIVASAFTDNIGSQKIMLKAGFTFVGKVKPNFKLEHKGRTDCSVSMYEWRW